MGDMKKYVIKMWGMILKWLGTTAIEYRCVIEKNLEKDKTYTLIEESQITNLDKQVRKMLKEYRTK